MRWLGATLLLISLAFGLGLLAWLFSRRGLDWAAKVSEVASFVMASAALLTPLIRAPFSGCGIGHPARSR